MTLYLFCMGEAAVSRRPTNDTMHLNLKLSSYSVFLCMTCTAISLSVHRSLKAEWTTEASYLELSQLISLHQLYV